VTFLYADWRTWPSEDWLGQFAWHGHAADRL